MTLITFSNHDVEPADLLLVESILESGKERCYLRVWGSRSQVSETFDDVAEALSHYDSGWVALDVEDPRKPGRGSRVVFRKDRIMQISDHSRFPVSYIRLKDPRGTAWTVWAAQTRRELRVELGFEQALAAVAPEREVKAWDAGTGVYLGKWNCPGHSPFEAARTAARQVIPSGEAACGTEYRFEVEGAEFVFLDLLDLPEPHQTPEP